MNRKYPFSEVFPRLPGVADYSDEATTEPRPAALPASWDGLFEVIWKDDEVRSPRPISSTAAILQQRLRDRMVDIVDRAKPFQDDFPDPIQSLVELMSSISDDYGAWRDIIETP